MKKLPYLTAWFLLVGYSSAVLSCRQRSRELPAASTEQMGSIPFPSAEPAAEPNLFTDSRGELWLSWLEQKDSTARLRYARLQDDHWTEPASIAEGRNWFVNWADFPQFVTDGNGVFLASTLVKSGRQKYAYDIHLYHSTDGRKWQGPVLAHDDGIAAEHGFVSLLPHGKQVVMGWLDGRHTEVKKNTKAPHVHAGAMTVRTALMDFSGKKSAEWEVDGRACDCCQTSLAMTGDGPVLVYRDRSDDEVRDISISRLLDGRWTAPATIFADNWRIDGCPVNGPRADAIGNELAVVWFSAPGNRPEVKVIFSHDGGRSFGKPVRIDEGKPLGRVDIRMADSTGAWVSWMEEERIRLVYVSADGSKGEAMTVALSSIDRSSGFPRMAIRGNRLVFAWTDNRKGKTIKTSTMAIR